MLVYDGIKGEVNLDREPTDEEQAYIDDVITDEIEKLLYDFFKSED